MNIKNLLIALCLMLGTAIGANAQCLEGQRIDVRYYVGDDEAPVEWVTIGAGEEFTGFAGLFDIDATSGMITVNYAGMTSLTGENVRLRLTLPDINEDGFAFGSASLSGNSTLPVTLNTFQFGQGRGVNMELTFTPGATMSTSDFAKINILAYGCDENPIPSMGQWALLILGLMMSSLALVKIKSSQIA